MDRKYPTTVFRSPPFIYTILRLDWAPNTTACIYSVLPGIRENVMLKFLDTGVIFESRTDHTILKISAVRSGQRNSNNAPSDIFKNNLAKLLCEVFFIKIQSKFKRTLALFFIIITALCGDMKTSFQAHSGAQCRFTTSSVGAINKDCTVKNNLPH